LWREVFVSSGPLSPLHSGEGGAEGQDAAARQLHGLSMALSSMVGSNASSSSAAI
jgi:hypothetical protein